MVVLGMLQHRLQRFGIARTCFAFQRQTFVFVLQQKIELQTTFLLEIVEFSTHLAQHVRDKILKNGTLVSMQIALQDVPRRPIVEHGDEQPDVGHIDLEHFADGIAT